VALKGDTRVSGYDNYSEVFDGDGHEQQTGGALRRQLEETLAANKRLEERLTQLERKETVGGLFKEKGIDPAAVALVPADADPQKWLEQNAQFLRTVEGVPANQEKQTAPEEKQTPPDPQLEAERQQLEGMEEAGNSGIPSTATADQITKLQSFDNEADLMAFINSGGGAG
jgi:hypothetical protein